MSRCTTLCKDAVPQAGIAGPQAYDNSVSRLPMCLYLYVLALVQCLIEQ